MINHVITGYLMQTSFPVDFELGWISSEMKQYGELTRIYNTLS